ncbi:MAG: tRNA (guanosine(37)-N1)-methyltransferase TrmD [Desulfobacterota bacterium]|nr:tRNA (guanosine(37)-N1)-methyltransferase TrmD [Thermodesulfobacteriota bacterium]
MIQFDVITLFPGMFLSPLQESILYKARQKGLVQIIVHDLRRFTYDKHNTADDKPYGGGPGMVMKVEPITTAVEHVRQTGIKTRVVLLSPQGVLFTQEAAQRLSTFQQIILVCGRYEGVDERVLNFVDEEISIGDYVLSGGELPAMVIIDTVARLVPGVVGDEASVHEDSFTNGLLKYPQYTRPATFRGLEVPEVLLSGDHERIKTWRRIEALRKTVIRRADLIERAWMSLTEQEKQFIATLRQSYNGDRP